MNVIEIVRLTKNYGSGRGIFDVSFTVKRGEVFGFLGPNGSGKTTTIRNLLGFIKPDSGDCHINELDCFHDVAKIHNDLSYLPGEIAFFEDMTGLQFIKFYLGLKREKDFNRAKKIIEYFELDPSTKIRKMSKGMKQKVGLVCAFMTNDQILILDEPTSGLDPLMQNKFIKLVLSEKEKGKTILMSSHSFEEVEKTCDRVAIIRAGKIVAVDNVRDLIHSKLKNYLITFSSSSVAKVFTNESFTIKSLDKEKVVVSIKGSISGLLSTLSKYEVIELEKQNPSLEEIFLHFYGENK